VVDTDTIDIVADCLASVPPSAEIIGILFHFYGDRSGVAMESCASLSSTDPGSPIAFNFQVRKRTAVLVGNMRFQSPDQADILFSHILGLLATSDYSKTLVATLSGLTKSSPRYTSGYVNEIWAVVKKIVSEQGGEEGVLEGGLQCLESLVGRCVGMGVYAAEVERIGLEFIKVWVAFVTG
jgi:hypothetical protein